MSDRHEAAIGQIDEPDTDIPSMGGSKISTWLEQTARDLTGAGAIVECGSWLGASIAPIVCALAETGSDTEVHCYDLWQATESEVRKAEDAGIDIDVRDNLLPLFLENVCDYPHLVTHKTDTLDAEWSGDPIEMYIDDANKVPKLFANAMRTFGPHFIPGETIIVLMDYQYYTEHEGEKRQLYRCQKDFIEAHPESFTLLDDLDGVCGVAFRYDQPVNWSGYDFLLPKEKAKMQVKKWLAKPIEWRKYLSTPA